MAVAVDVADHDSVVAMVDTAVEAHGKIDIVINGAMRTGRSTFLKATVAEFRDEFEVNLLGSFLVCQSAIPVMIAGGGGVIINISSVNGITHLGNEAYSAAKAGLIALTRGVACEFGEHGIRCCGVAPGTVRTEVWAHREANDPGVLDRAASWYPLGRIGDPEDIAAALMFLASDQASWISGVTLPVDGGLLAGNLAMSRAITAGDSD